jgi:hypothetical protein
MVIGSETGSDGVPSRVLSARPRACRPTLARVMRAARRLARRGVMVAVAATSLGLLAGLGVAAPAAGRSATKAAPRLQAPSSGSAITPGRP